MSPPAPPFCLSFGCLDASGGSGIAVDLKTSTARDCYGAAVATGVLSMDLPATSAATDLPKYHLVQQLAGLDRLAPDAIKVGLVPSSDLIHSVARWLRERPQVPVVIDPVFVNPIGIPLVNPEVISAAEEQLLPRATVLTPNRFEAALLAGLEEILGRDDMELAARRIFDRFGCPTLVTGGGLLEGSLDVFCGVDGVSHFGGHETRVGRLVGAGCTLSAAITAELARGEHLREAIAVAKGFVSRLIENTAHREVGINDTLVLWHAQAVSGADAWAV